MSNKTIQEKVQPIINKITTNRYLKAVSDGIASILPAIIVGAIFTLLANLPISPYQDFLTSSGLGQILKLPITFTTDLIALYSVFFIGYKLSESFEGNGAIAGLLSLVSFFVVTPLVFAEKVKFISFEWLGAKGLFVAIIVGLVASRLYVAIIKKGIIIKMPNGVPPTISSSFTALVPAFIVIPFFSVVAMIFSKTDFASVHGFVYKFVQTPLEGLGGTLTSLIIVMIVAHVLWLFGIHGIMVSMSIMMPIWTSLNIQNLEAYNNGDPLPNIICSAFLMVYVLVGGSGGTLGLNLYMSFKGRSKRYKTLGNLSLPGSLCSINEPLIFGTPVIMNPKLAIPFVATPVVCAIIAYYATYFGFVPRLMGAALPLGTPIGVSGFLQGGFSVVILQMILVVVSFIIYLPFARSLDKEAYEQELNESDDEVDFSDIDFE